MTTATEILPLSETIAPADEAAVADTVRDAWNGATPVYPIGGGTSLDYGGRPHKPGLGLSLANLDGVIDYPVGDMTITVEAGLTMAKLAARLAAERQRLPVDVAEADRATIGGVVATNHSGPRRYANGTMRDYVIGIRAVDGLGTAFAGGGRVVKNVAGYDLCRLMVGSLGTIGVITQVTLMVRPLPESSAIVVCELPDLDAVERLIGQLVHSQTLPAAIELLAGPPSRENPSVGPMLESSVAQVLVGFEGSEAEVGWMVDQLKREWREAGVPTTVTIPATEVAPVWNWLTELPASVRIDVMPGAAIEIIGQLLRLVPSCSIQAHAGSGTIRVGFSPAVSDDFAIVLGNLRPAVTAADGNLVVLSAPGGAELTPQDVWGPPGDGFNVMQAIKDRFDPEGLLNPDRFVFGA